MKLRHLTPLALLGVTGIALAAGWSDFGSAFVGLPCPDGWAACLIDGEPVDPGMVSDSAGRPHPSDMRVGFFDLKPLPGFSPFAGLSSYTAQPAAVAAAAVPEPVVKASPPAQAPVQPVALERDPVQPAADPVVRERNPPPLSRPVETTAASASRADPEPEQPVIQPPPEPVAAAAIPEPEVVEPEPVVAAAPDPVAVADPPQTTAARTVEVSSTGCDDWISLESPAMMGNLGVGQRKCLEGKIAENSQTSKNKISRLLIMDAEARGDRADWERLMKRHLQDIDRSDPNLCFKYAIHLSRGGPSRAHGVIKWADYALENKQSWSGNTYKKNVNALYKLRAQAANKLWQSAEAKYVEDRTDENEASAQRYRDMTKNYAREWLDYARASGQSTKGPLSLCVSAAGSTEFCEG